MVLLFYGFAKINGAQFTVLDSELDKPMAKVSGFWLTWHYFGFSPVFGTLVAVGQIVLALLLCWRRTTLLASCIGLGMMTVILLIDIIYGVDFQGTFAALLTAASLGVIVAQHRKDLLRLFWTEQAEARPHTPRNRRLTKIAALTALLLATGAGTYWIANENNVYPTPLDGAWSVTAGQYHSPGMHRPLDKVYFERNRAYMVVFRFGDQQAQHHFEVDPASKKLKIWEHWEGKGRQVFSGTYQFKNAGHLLLEGKFDGSGPSDQLDLTRTPSAR
ncbi:hypothetical protein [Streptomyces sp. CT34]|uniref:hypothetical protein n=1 Tax=Streptomyces sp. CT34 TaxID=1553907 RepID=UPI0018E29E14|nr:hypothetical protein [Streptomyces sp. CT34]